MENGAIHYYNMMSHREMNERMMAGERHIIEDMKWLLMQKPEDMLTWKSTKNDLFLMVKVLYDSCEVLTKYNERITFVSLAQRFCDILHMKMPRNPRAYALQGMRCKGERRAHLFLRYEKLFI